MSFENVPPEGRWGTDEENGGHWIYGGGQIEAEKKREEVERRTEAAMAPLPSEMEILMLLRSTGHDETFKLTIERKLDHWRIEETGEMYGESYLVVGEGRLFDEAWRNRARPKPRLTLVSNG